MENKLTYLLALQNIDIKLLEIHELKGDLPEIVSSLEVKIGDVTARIKELNDFIKKSKIDRDDKDVEIIELAEKVDKYKNQQLQVKSNKQYDALTKEIEGAEEKSFKLEKEMEVLEGKILIAKKDIETITKQSADLNAELEDRQKELKSVNKENEKEELKLNHEREKIVVRIDKVILERYERIRKAKGGKAVVPIKKGSCGGCFNRLPPQKILELKQNTKLFTCEHCGRIIVSDQIVEMVSSLR